MISSFERSVSLPIGKYGEHIECPRANRDRMSRAVFVLFQETPAPPIEAKALEQQHVSRGERIHSCRFRRWVWIVDPSTASPSGHRLP